MESSSKHSSYAVSNFESFENELSHQAHQPPGHDVRIAAFATALIDEIADTAIRTHLELTLQKRNQMTGSYAVNLVLRAYQKQLLLKDPAYPFSYDSKSVWRSAMNEISHDQAARAELLNDIEQRTTQSNISERYKSLKLILTAFNNRLPDNPKILDIGCSQNQGLKRLALNMPFSPVISEDQTFADKLNLVIETPIRIGNSLGTDIEPLTDDNSNWARVCSFYPSELLDKDKIDTYDFLDKATVSSLDFVQSDFVNKGIVDDDKYVGSFDIVFASTFMYQLSDIERQTTQSLMQHYSKPTGLIVYQDFINIDTKDNKLQFLDNWFISPYSYRTVIDDRMNEVGRLQEFLRWDNGRCSQVQAGADYHYFSL